MIQFFIAAGSAALNAGLYAATGHAVSLGAAVFCGLCAIGIAFMEAS